MSVLKEVRTKSTRDNYPFIYPVVELTEDAPTDVRVATGGGIGCIPHAPTSSGCKKWVRVKTSSAIRILTNCVFASSFTVDVAGLGGDLSDCNGTWTLSLQPSGQRETFLQWGKEVSTDKYVRLWGGKYNGRWGWRGQAKYNTGGYGYCQKQWITPKVPGTFPDGLTFSEDICYDSDCFDTTTCSASSGATFNVTGHTI